jgi:hypothetical protein
LYILYRLSMPANQRGAQDVKRVARAEVQTKKWFEKEQQKIQRKAKIAAFDKTRRLERQKNNMLIQNNQEVNERR